MNQQILELEIGREEEYYDFKKIEDITGRKEFFTNSATVRGNSPNDLTVKTNSLVTMESCLGHFGTELTRKTLRIPLLIITDIMLFAVEIGIKSLFPNIIPIPINAKVLKAEISELMSPPATVETVATNFALKGDIIIAEVEARVNSRKYASVREFSFLLIHKDDFLREDAKETSSVIPQEFLEGYKEKEKLFYSGMIRLVEERAPFLNLGEIVFLKSEIENSHGYSWRAISITQLEGENCYRSSRNGRSFVSPVDCAKATALTAELLVSYISNTLHSFAVPLAVKAKEVNASSEVFLYPPVTLITVADITKKNIEMAVKSREKGYNSFHVTSMKTGSTIGGKFFELVRIEDLSFFLTAKKKI